MLTDKELKATCEEKIGGKAARTILAWLMGTDLSTFKKWGEDRPIPRYARTLLEHIADSGSVTISLEPERGYRIMIPAQKSVSESVRYEIREALRDALLDLQGKTKGREDQGAKVKE